MGMVHFTRGRTFDPATGDVTVSGRTVRLEPQPAVLLELLASRPDTLVTHAEIRERLWGDGRHVAYSAGVHYAVRQIRRALDDGETDGADLESLPRRGYRVPATAVVTPPVTYPPRSGDASHRSGRGTRWVAAALLGVAVVTWVERQPNDHHRRVTALARALHDAIY